MTETTITDAIVWPEDKGTGAPVAADEGDWASAAYHASLATATGADYVETGLGLNYNPSDTTMDVGDGVAFVKYTGSSTVQLDSSSYDTAWDEDLIFMVDAPAVSNLSLDSGAVNDVYLAVDPTGGDSARLRYGSSVSAPSDPHVKLGEVDTSTDTTTERNRNPSLSADSVTTPEMTLNGTSVTSLTGANLSVSGGTLNATQNTTTTLWMSDYSSGGVCDAEFDSAISDASPGDRIVFDHNSYELAGNHVISKSLTIDSTRDSTLSLTQTSNNDAQIEFRGGGTGSSTTTTAALVEGQRSIAVNDSSAFAAGDRILVMDGTYSETVDATMQFMSIESVPDASTINVFGSTAREFPSGATVYVVDLLDSPRIQNLSTDGGGHRHFQFSWCENPEYRDVTVSEYQEVSLLARDCWKPRWDNVEATAPTSRSSGHGEPISVYRCSDAYIESPRVYDVRRGIDFAWGAHSCTVVDPVIQGFSIAGISIHGGDHCDQISIQGGTLVADPDGLVGNGIFNTEFCTMQVTGTTIVGRESCIKNYGPIQASNLTLKPCSANATVALAIKGSHARYENVHIEDSGGLFNEGVRVDTAQQAVEDVYVNADIIRNGDNAFYVETSNTGGQTIENVQFCGTVRGGGTGEAMWIYPNQATIDNVDISVDVNGFTDQAVRLNGDSGLGTVRIHDCYMECGKAAVYSRNALGTDCTVQINNCVFDTGATSISFNDTTGTLMVSDTEASGSINASAVNDYRIGADRVVAEGSISLISGTATISTGVEQPIDVFLDPSNGGANSQDIDVVASALYDASAAEMVVEITEDSTAVGDPTVAFQIMTTV